ncbi:hypothetical protein ACF1BS_01515 [Streptomyces sp. NPDC014748]|uniref:hypothetical protein n=1 Tax=Streptomyces sp. NPDC014748 TaxID=3364905 RepID=UPI0036FBC80E
MSAKTEDTSTMSAECALAQQPGYKDLHRQCRQTKDIPLPHSSGLLLVHRCTCPHHRHNPA